jgi:hypothetical protein
MSLLPRLSSRGRWGLAVLLVGLLGLGGLAAAPFLYRQSLAPGLDDARQMLALLEAKLQAAGGKVKPPLVAAADAPKAFVEGATAGLATAALQRQVVDLATAAGLRVEKVQPLPAEDHQGLATLRLQIDTAGSLEALRGFLLTLEAGTPLLFVKEAHIATPVAAEGQAEDAGQRPADNLTAGLTIEGFGWWGPAP